MILNNPLEVLNETPPFVHVPGLFTDSELQSMGKIFSSNELEKAHVGQEERSFSEVRRSSVKFYQKTPETDWIFNRLNGMIDDINSRFFNFDLIGYDAIQYTEYNGSEMGHYDFHQDTQFGRVPPGNPSGLRKLSIVVALTNQGQDFTGGDFEIVTGNQNSPMRIGLSAGDAVVFPSFMIHRVAPVLEGKRKSLVAWVIGPKFK